jgi:ectoine hydroxylase-related dioxygenase (phytanoyl-CoA dioxygenase family)
MPRLSSVSLLPASTHEQLTTQGWALLPGLIPKTQLPALHAAWERVEAREPSRGNNWGPRALDQEPAFAALLGEARVLAAVSALLGEGAVLRAFNGRCPPHQLGRQGLHTDWAAPVPPDGQLLANVFFSLDGMDEENGATRIVPESHRWARLPRGIQAQPGGKHPNERSLRAAPGDAVVFSSHLWHARDENRSGRRRRVAIAQFARVF